MSVRALPGIVELPHRDSATQWLQRNLPDMFPPTGTGSSNGRKGARTYVVQCSVCGFWSSGIGIFARGDKVLTGFAIRPHRGGCEGARRLDHAPLPES